ncbi:MAG: endo alpha-1,4 polygalactosaminidase [Polyangiales bacterium]
MSSRACAVLTVGLLCVISVACAAACSESGAKGTGHGQAGASAGAEAAGAGATGAGASGAGASGTGVSGASGSSAGRPGGAGASGDTSQVSGGRGGGRPSEGGRAGEGGRAAGSGGRSAAAGGGGAAASGSGGRPAPGELRLPPLNGGLDYQLGGAYSPASSVTIVSRDRTDQPASGLYNICYVNGFQAQPSENDFWLNDHPDLILRDDGGEPVVDEGWDELIFDVSTADKRTRLAAIVAEWIAGCARSGFDAIEIDNLDSYSRSDGRLEREHAVAFVRLLSDAAHANGLAIAQKNASELVSRKAEMGTDFVVAEECNRWDECGDYRDGYGDHVLVIEYRRQDFEKGCADFPNLSIVLRDVPLTPSGRSGYVFDGC